MSALVIILVVVASFGWLATQVAGTVIARRAWRRYGLMEAQLVYRGFLWGLILFLVSAVALPLVSLITSYGESITPFRIASVLFAIANGSASIAVAVGMYRLARRGAEER